MDCQIVIGNVFTFNLVRSNKSDPDVIREELALLKQEKM